MIEFIPKEKIDDDLALQSIKTDPYLIIHIPSTLQTFKDIIIEIIKIDPFSISVIPKEIIDKIFDKYIILKLLHDCKYGEI